MSEKILAQRDKPLNQMMPYELICWLRNLCNLWTFERANLSLGLGEVEEELLRTCKETIRMLEGFEEARGA